jgi:hypothetical protein
MALVVVVEAANCETWMMMKVVEATENHHYHFFWEGGVVTYFHQKRKAVGVKNLSLQVVAVGVRFYQKVVVVLLLVVERPLLGVGVRFLQKVVVVERSLLGAGDGTLLEAAMTPMVVVEKPEILQERVKT